MAKRHKKEHHEEHISEGWLVPYADILTLLLALFIVLFASSQVDQKKFIAVAASLGAALGSGNGSANGISILDNNPSLVTPTPSATEEGTREMQRLQQEMGERVETADLKKLKKELDQYIKDSGLQGKLTTNLGGDGLLIRISESALFPSGSAELIPSAKLVSEEIAKLLVGKEQNITIAGHTDNMPIRNSIYPSNWELSTMRAINFMQYMLAHANLQAEKFRVVGYSEYRPIASNLTEAGRAKNRRVEVMISRIYKVPKDDAVTKGETKPENR